MRQPMAWSISESGKCNSVLPQSEGGLLPAGTAIMLGAGVIVPSRAYCQVGDVITVSCPQIGELSNTVARAEPAPAGLSSRPLRAGLP